jgi:glycosyltransferase involved in cell wall biosynthesis
VNPHILLVDARVLTPDRDGGSLRMASLVRVFQSLGCSIAFVPSFPESFPPFNDSLAADTERMRALGIDMPPPGTTVDEHLERYGRRYDAILLTGTFVASRHLASVRRLAPQAAVVFDTIDLHFLREYRGARLAGSVPRLQGALRIKRVELAIARSADFTLVVSEREQRVLAGETPPIRSWVVPLTCEVEPSPGPEGRRDLIYLGAFSFDPNVDAMVFFVGRVLPRIERRLPGITLHVAGSDPTPDVMNLQGSGVNVTGPIPRLAERFDRCRAFVAPLRYGAGVKGKLLLSMAHGLPVVASTIAAEGIPARDGLDLLVADAPADWEEQVVRVCQDDALWTTLSANGKALVRTHHAFEVVRSRVAPLVEAIAARRPGQVSHHS